MSSDNMIELKNIWKKYSARDIFHKSLREDLLNIFRKKDRESLKTGEFWALKDINISIKKGECVGLYGPNGSGKSTILKLIASVTFPTKGEVKVKDKVAPLISVGAGFHQDLSGRENIYMNGAIIGMTRKELTTALDQIIEFSEIDHQFIDMPVKKYSSGMYVRLGFSIAVHSSAENLLIDEILAVGDESFQKKCMNKIKELNRMGRTIVLVSHDKQRMEQLTQRIYYLDKGHITNVTGN